MGFGGKLLGALLAGVVATTATVTGVGGAAIASVQPQVSMRIAPKGTPPPSVSPGRAFYYETNVFFDGPTKPDEIELVNTMPTGVKVLTKQVWGSASCVDDPARVQCVFTDQYNAVAPGSSHFFVVSAQVDPSVPVGSKLSSTVELRAKVGGQVVGQQSHTYTWDVVAPQVVLQDRPDLFPQPRTLTLDALPTSDSEQQRTMQDNKWPDVQPTGFYLPAGTPMTVNVQGAATAKLMVGAWALIDPNAPSRLARPEPAFYPLNAGANTVTDGFGGPIFIQYTKDSLQAPAPPKITVTLDATAQPIPYFRQGAVTGDQWRAMLAASKIPYAMLVGKRIMLALSTENAGKQQQANQDAVMTEYERFQNIEESIGGFDGSKPAHQISPLRQLIVEGPTSEPNRNAASYRVQFPHQYNTAEYLTPEGVHRDWGMWHELGHQRQQMWTWSATTETTVNIFALAVRRSDPSVTPTEGHGTKEEWDQAWAWLNKPLAQRNFECIPPTADNDPNCRYSEWFTRLAMFEQLRLVYGDGWMQRVHQVTREEQPKLADGDNSAKRRYFMTTACKVAGQDLSDYFTNWAIGDSKDICRSLGLPKPVGDLWQVATFGGGKKLTTSTDPADAGSVQLDPPTGQYGTGSQVKATAKPSGGGGAFTGWLLDGKPAGNTPELTVTMDADHTLVAQFGKTTPPALPLSETFRTGQSPLDLWKPLAKQGGQPPCLTAATTAQPGSLPACGAAAPDAAGQGALRLTSNGEGQSAGVILNKAIPTKDGLKVDFDMFGYDAKLWSDRGADGMSMFLLGDTEANTQPGGSGGGLSYGGLKSTLLGVGFDQYGNFSATTVATPTGRQPNFATGPGQAPNSIVVRGPDSGGYAYLGGAASPQPLGVPTAATRDAAKRHVTITVKNNVLNVAVDYGDGKGPQQLISNLSLNTNGQPALPQTVKIGFGASTGKGTSIHEIRDLVINKPTP